MDTQLTKFSFVKHATEHFDADPAFLLGFLKGAEELQQKWAALIDAAAIASEDPLYRTKLASELLQLSQSGICKQAEGFDFLTNMMDDLRDYATRDRIVRDPNTQQPSLVTGDAFKGLGNSSWLGAGGGGLGGLMLASVLGVHPVIGLILGALLGGVTGNYAGADAAKGIVDQSTATRKAVGDYLAKNPDIQGLVAKSDLVPEGVKDTFKNLNLDMTKTPEAITQSVNVQAPVLDLARKILPNLNTQDIGPVNKAITLAHNVIPTQEEADKFRLSISPNSEQNPISQAVRIGKAIDIKSTPSGHSVAFPIDPASAGISNAIFNAYSVTNTTPAASGVTNPPPGIVLPKVKK